MQLTTAKIEVGDLVKSFKGLLHPQVPYEKVLLFGSHAKSNAGVESDIDILIVSEETDINKLFEIGIKCRLLAWQLNSLIEPKVVSAEKFASPPEGSILAEIKRTAIEIV